MASESCKVLALHFSDPRGYYVFKEDDRKTDGYYSLSMTLKYFLNNDCTSPITSHIVNLAPMSLVQFNPDN